jgi:hypothetical protein
MFWRLAVLMLAMCFGMASAAASRGSAGFLFAPTTSTPGTVSIFTIDGVEVLGIIPSVALTNGLIALSGATGSDITFCEQNHICLNATPSQACASTCINWTVPNKFSQAVFFINPTAPVGGADGCNTASFTASISDGTGSAAGNVLTVTATSSGVISGGMSPTLTATGVPAGVHISGFGTGAGYTGTYTIDGSPLLIASESMTSNGNLAAPKTTTYCNRVTTSGINYHQVIADTVTYAHNTYGISLAAFNGLGHSNGAMQMQSEILEHAGLFQHVAVASGPKGIYYNVHSSLPGTITPMLAFTGDDDEVVCTAAYEAGCPATTNVLTASFSGTTMHVTAIASGAVTVGNKLSGSNSGTSDGNVPAGTYINAQIATAGGDIATYTVSNSFTLASQTVYSNNFYDSTYGQNNTKISPADDVYPLKTYWVSWPNLMATWANAKCSAGVPTQLDPSTATTSSIRVGVERVFEPCGHNGGVELVEISNGPHSYSTMELDLGYPIIYAADAWFAVN